MSEPFASGTALGGYRLLRMLGRGGFGAVYEAVPDRGTPRGSGPGASSAAGGGASVGAGGDGRLPPGTHVALKVLERRLDGWEDFERSFLREVRNAQRVQHPNVVRILDYGALPDGRLFYAMELAEGPSLRKLAEAEGGRLQPHRAVRLTVQVLGALGAMHGQGMVHRDIKPDNVHVVPGGAAGTAEVAKLLDFGLAKIVGAGRASQDLTAVGRVMGTTDYMSPEHLMGKPLDAGTDLYSVGVMLYELLAGRRPFMGDTRAVVEGHLGRAPPPLGELAHGHAEPGLEAAIARALAKDRRARFATADEMAQALLDACPESSRSYRLSRIGDGRSGAGAAAPSGGAGTGRLLGSAPTVPRTRVGHGPTGERPGAEAPTAPMDAAAAASATGVAPASAVASGSVVRGLGDAPTIAFDRLPGAPSGGWTPSPSGLVASPGAAPAAPPTALPAPSRDPRAAHTEVLDVASARARVASAPAAAGSASGVAAGPASGATATTPPAASAATGVPERGAGTSELPLGGRYVLTAVLSDRSKHAITYEALDRATGARVCLAWLRGDRAAQPEDVQRYLRGIATLAEVRHPHVVALLDGGASPDGRPYFVTEWLPGRPLRWFLDARGAVPLAYAAGALCQMLAGLAAAHHHHVVHRDITPDHILVVPTAEGAVVKLFGFGSARSIVAADGTATAWGVPVGTPGYGPPEQLRGQPLDGRADLFATGVVFYEMLAGFPPYRGATPLDVARAVIQAAAPALPESVPVDVRAAAGPIIAKALARAPAERFQTAESLRAALLPLAREHAFGDFAGLDLDAAIDPGEAP